MTNHTVTWAAKSGETNWALDTLSLVWGFGVRVAVGGCFKGRLIGRVGKLRFRAAWGATSAG
jgi:hypothetical protein